MLQSGLKKRKEPSSYQGPASQGPRGAGGIPEASRGCWHQVVSYGCCGAGGNGWLKPRGRAGLEINGLLFAPLLCDSEEVPALSGPRWGGLAGSGWMPWEHRSSGKGRMRWCQGESMRVVGLLSWASGQSNMSVCWEVWL